MFAETGMRVLGVEWIDEKDGAGSGSGSFDGWVEKGRLHQFERKERGTESMQQVHRDFVSQRTLYCQ